MADDPTQTPNTTAPPPTQDAIAIAVKQENSSNAVPQVIAGGRGRVAEQILEIAFSQGIRVREDADLAQMLSVVDVESEIPLEAFATVAEILTYVYETNNAMKPDGNTHTEDEAEASSPANAAEMAASWEMSKGNIDE